MADPSGVALQGERATSPMTATRRGGERRGRCVTARGVRLRVALAGGLRSREGTGFRDVFAVGPRVGDGLGCLWCRLSI